MDQLAKIREIMSQVNGNSEPDTMGDALDNIQRILDGLEPIEADHRPTCGYCGTVFADEVELQTHLDSYA